MSDNFGVGQAEFPISVSSQSTPQTPFANESLQQPSFKPMFQHVTMVLHKNYFHG